MSASTDGPPNSGHQAGSHTHAQPNDPLYAELARSEDFQELRKRYRGFVFPATAGFLLWYFLYVCLSNWAPGFMGTRVFGYVNWGLILGLLQFVTTFAIAWFYARYAAANFDPLADRIKARYDAGDRA